MGPMSYFSVMNVILIIYDSSSCYGEQVTRLELVVMYDPAD